MSNGTFSKLIAENKKSEINCSTTCPVDGAELLSATSDDEIPKISNPNQKIKMSPHEISTKTKISTILTIAIPTKADCTIRKFKIVIISTAPVTKNAKIAAVEKCGWYDRLANTSQKSKPRNRRVITGNDDALIPDDEIDKVFAKSLIPSAAKLSRPKRG